MTLRHFEKASRLIETQASEVGPLAGASGCSAQQFDQGRRDDQMPRLHSRFDAD